MPRRHRTFADWCAWRRTHYADGTPKVTDPECEMSPLLASLLSTRRGAIAVLRADRRYAEQQRAQHTPPPLKDAGYLHTAYGRRHGKAPR